MLLRGGSPYMVCKTVMSTFYYLDLHSILAARHFDEMAEELNSPVLDFVAEGFGPEALSTRIGRPADASSFQRPSRGRLAFLGGIFLRRGGQMSLIADRAC